MFPFDEKMANFKAQNRRLVPRFQYRVLHHVKELSKFVFKTMGNLKENF